MSPVVIGDVPVVFAYGEGESNHVVQVEPSEQRHTVKADGGPSCSQYTIQADTSNKPSRSMTTIQVYNTFHITIIWSRILAGFFFYLLHLRYQKSNDLNYPSVYLY